MNLNLDLKIDRVVGSVAAICFVLLLGSGKLIYDREIARKVPATAEQLEKDNLELSREKDSLIEGNTLAPLSTYWAKVLRLASMYDLEMSFIEQPQNPLYEGALSAWHGTLTGEKTSLLAALRQIQAVAPVYLYDISFDSENGTVYFSVVGAE